jgi:hypothetical protein
MLQVIAGNEADDPASADVPVPDFMAELGTGVQNIPIGIPRDWFLEGQGTDPDVLAAFDEAIDEGYDPQYGARPLKRVIQKQLLDPIALKPCCRASSAKEKSFASTRMRKASCSRA